MYLCYIDESGTFDIPGNSSQYVLAGLSIPIWKWKEYDNDIEHIKKKYRLDGKEIHVAWILRPYLEQAKIPDFDQMSYTQRVYNVEVLRNAELLRLQKAKNPDQYKQTKKNFQKTKDYIHLSLQERRELINDLAKIVSDWKSARLFAECIDKLFFNPLIASQQIDEQCFEQIVSRFEQYLQIIEKSNKSQCFGLLIHDNNDTVAKRYTEIMKKFHYKGTLWTEIKNIIETPLFVNSELTSMVQIADLCAYALRRYLENNEDSLFNLIFKRADRKDDVVVGIRHFSNKSCNCKICAAHKK